ncbi:MAG: zinc ribbon domain-containing protein [Candidatus Zixiibacteriota bacterium]
MPIYVYQCARCGHRFEELVFSAAAEAALRCPRCRSEQIVRQLSPFATTVASGCPDRSCAGDGG